MDWIFWAPMFLAVVSGVAIGRGIANGDWESGYTSDAYNPDGTKKENL